MPFTYATEDGPLLLTMLEEGRYDVVVGNPPYITVKDKALNQIYRSKYAERLQGHLRPDRSVHGAVFRSSQRRRAAGWVGQITSNSFMKREFGTKLIEDFLAHQDLRLVADTSGAYIPGHGTPTVIIVGRNQRPVELDCPCRAWACAVSLAAPTTRPRALSGHQSSNTSMTPAGMMAGSLSLTLTVR